MSAMLDYLVTSKSRRTLLKLLWAERRSGSVSELARLGGMSFRSAHKELNEMLNAGLAECHPVGNATVFRAAEDHPGARALRSILQPTPPAPAGERRTQAQDRVRAWLKAWGAPLEARVDPGDLPSCESVFVQGVRLARTDASVARSLPVFVWKNRNHLDRAQLRHEALSSGERHAVGFFLYLTGTLGNDRALLDAAGAFRDRRRRRVRDFFPTRSSLERELAEERTPPVARDWHFRMNMSLRSFASTFERFARDAQVQD